MYGRNASNPFTNYVKIVAKLANLEYEYVHVKDEELADYAKTINPTGFLPYLQTEEGGIAESNAIARFIANSNPDSGLYGTTVQEQSSIDEAIERFNSAVNSYIWKAVLCVTGHVPVADSEYKDASKKVKDFLRTLDEGLKDREFVAGEKLSLADIYYVSTLSVLYGVLIDGGFAKAVPSLTKYFETHRDSDTFTSALGKQRYLKKPLKPKTL